MDTTTQKLIEVYKTLLESQHNNYNTLFTVLIALTTILAGSSWLWNIFIAKRQIKTEVESFKDDLELSFKNKEFELIEKIKIDIKKEFDEKYNELYIDLSRLFGIIADEKGQNEIAINWWFNCLERSIENDVVQIIRVSVTQVGLILDKEIFKEYDADFFDLEAAIEITKKIPTILNSEKRQILKKLTALKKKD